MSKAARWCGRRIMQKDMCEDKSGFVETQCIASLRCIASPQIPTKKITLNYFK